MKKRIIKKLRYILDSVKLLAFDAVIRKDNCVIVFGAPSHSNMGDQAQSYCIEQWFTKSYPEKRVVIFETDFFNRNAKRFIQQLQKRLKKEDMLVLHSGYHTTDLYMQEENMQRMIVKAFPNKKIIILPQTIYYASEEEKKKARKIYNSHQHIILMCRDEVSYTTAQKMFPNCKLLLYPDIVTTMIGKMEPNFQRSGILMCMRDDQEAFYTKEAMEKLRRELLEIDKVDRTDTTLRIPVREIRNRRKEILESLWKEYSNYRVVVTDRYHGTIFSLIAQTPVLVISSTDHKLKSGVKWFPDSFCPYVKFVENIVDVPAEVSKIYASSYDYKLPEYFNTEYYNTLKEKLEE